MNLTTDSATATRVIDPRPVKRRRLLEDVQISSKHTGIQRIPYSHLTFAIDPEQVAAPVSGMMSGNGAIAMRPDFTTHTSESEGKTIIVVDAPDAVKAQVSLCSSLTNLPDGRETFTNDYTTHHENPTLSKHSHVIDGGELASTPMNMELSAAIAQSTSTNNQNKVPQVTNDELVEIPDSSQTDPRKLWNRREDREDTQEEEVIDTQIETYALEPRASNIFEEAREQREDEPSGVSPNSRGGASVLPSSQHTIPSSAEFEHDELPETLPVFQSTLVRQATDKHKQDIEGPSAHGHKIGEGAHRAMSGSPESSAVVPENLIGSFAQRRLRYAVSDVHTRNSTGPAQVHDGENVSDNSSELSSEPEGLIEPDEYVGKKNGERPDRTWRQLIRAALRQSVDSELTVNQICAWITETYTYYKHYPVNRLKSSVGAVLCQKAEFVKTNVGKISIYEHFRWRLRSADGARTLSPEKDDTPHPLSVSDSVRSTLDHHLS